MSRLIKITFLNNKFSLEPDIKTKIWNENRLTSLTEVTFNRWNIGIKRTWTIPATIQYESKAKIMYCIPYVKTSAVAPSKTTEEK